MDFPFQLAATAEDEVGTLHSKAGYLLPSGGAMYIKKSRSIRSDPRSLLRALWQLLSTNYIFSWDIHLNNSRIKTV